MAGPGLCTRLLPYPTPTQVSWLELGVWAKYPIPGTRVFSRVYPYPTPDTRGFSRVSVGYQFWLNFANYLVKTTTGRSIFWWFVKLFIVRRIFWIKVFILVTIFYHLFQSLTPFEDPVDTYWFLRRKRPDTWHPNTWEKVSRVSGATQVPDTRPF